MTGEEKVLITSALICHIAILETSIENATVDVVIEIMKKDLDEANKALEVAKRL